MNIVDYFVPFQMTTDPFQKNNLNKSFSTIDQQQVIQRLNNLLVFNGLGVITGPPGCGKTTAVRTWSDSLNKASHKIIYETLATLSVADYFRRLSHDFGNEPRYRKSDNFDLIRSSIRTEVIENRRKVVIIIDEAQQLRPSTITDLKMLFNFEMDSKNLATVILIGQNNLINNLLLETNRAIRQRINMTYSMKNITLDETIEYIKFKVQEAGGANDLFTPNAIEKIYKEANGAPRIIDAICSNCLIVGNKLKTSIINAEVVDLAVAEISLSY